MLTARTRADAAPCSALPLRPQIGQDEVVLDILGGKRGGYFLDLAAHDALYLSNSYGLEAMYGWGGLCIEVGSRGRGRVGAGGGGGGGRTGLGPEPSVRQA